MNKLIIQIVLIILTFNKSIVKSQESIKECLEPFCTCLNNNKTLYCSKFTNYDQLDFMQTNGHQFEQVELSPEGEPLELNENLNFYGLKLNGQLSLGNIRSFSAFYNPFRRIDYVKLNLKIYNSYLKFFGGGIDGPNELETKIINDCRLDGDAELFYFVFSGVEITEFTLDNVLFESKLCPLLFKNSLIHTMSIINPSGAYGFQNVIRSTKSSQLNAHIEQLELTFTKNITDRPHWLDSSILNNDMFNNMIRININSANSLAFIREDAFTGFPKLKRLELKNVHLKELLVRNRQWIKNLNYYQANFDMNNINNVLTQSLSDQIFQLIIWIDDDWTFNDEKDICLFKDFPHQKLVFPFLMNTSKSLPCT
jgi:hypothetical protein